MSDWHGYLGIENLGLNTLQKETLLAALNGLGPVGDFLPARLNHWRTRLDHEARIYEARFNTDHLTVRAFKTRLANIFGISPDSIEHTGIPTSVGAVVTFWCLGMERLRAVFFGYDGATWPTWAESRAAALNYLAGHLEEWETDSGD